MIERITTGVESQDSDGLSVVIRKLCRSTEACSGVFFFFREHGGAQLTEHFDKGSRDIRRICIMARDKVNGRTIVSSQFVLVDNIDYQT